MNKRYFLTILCGVAALALVVGYVWYRLAFVRSPGENMTPSCLKGNQVAVAEKAGVSSYIVIKDRGTNGEVRRIGLPADTLFVQEPQQCEVYALRGNNAAPCSENCFGASHELLKGGSLERWKYSYDGAEERLVTIANSPTTRLAISSAGEYVATWMTAEGVPFDAKILEVETGTQVFPSDGSRSLTEVVKGVVDRLFWTTHNGAEAFGISYEQPNTGAAHTAYINTTTWVIEQ